LRREEVAHLAGISVTWYTWLEQKRPIHVSAGALDNLVRVLRLDSLERIQLFQLALRQPAIDSTSERETVSRRLQRLIDHNATYAGLCHGPSLGRTRVEPGGAYLLFRFRAGAR
jgi:hypothetical protein